MYCTRYRVERNGVIRRRLVLIQAPFIRQMDQRDVRRPALYEFPANIIGNEEGCVAADQTWHERGPSTCRCKGIRNWGKGVVGNRP